MKNLITGINGFAASHLTDLLVSSGEEVIGIARDPSKNENTRHHANHIQVYTCDVRRGGEIREVLKKVRPHRIYHMASVSFVPSADQDWNQAFETNVFGALQLFQAVKDCKIEARIIFVGSSEEYGMIPPSDLPVRETNPLRPVTLYGVTKASASLLANSFVQREGLDIIYARPFNHIGPRQSERFVCSSFARQIAGMEAGNPKLLKVGNLEAQRDFMDVRDTVRAYKTLMEKGDVGGVYNVCSGKTTSIRTILDELKKLTDQDFEIESDPSRFRPERPVKYYGDHALITLRTGWVPEIPLEQSLKDILSYWKKILRQKKSGISEV